MVALDNVEHAINGLINIDGLDLELRNQLEGENLVVVVILADRFY